MGASGWALRLLPPLLLFLLGAESQTQVCSVHQKLHTVKENELPNTAVANITTPPGQTVVVGPSSSPVDIFKVVGSELVLTKAPDYETNPVLTAILECKEGSTVVTRQLVIVEVINVNDVPPEFAFSSRAWDVLEDTRVGSTVIPATELTATDKDGDILFYSLSGMSPDQAFSLAGVNFPALQLDKALDYEKNPRMVFQIVARDTATEAEQDSHTATATITIQVVPVDMRPPWFLPCSFTDGRICIHAQYRGAVYTGHVLTSPLALEPGPVYAIDGDTAINEKIIYSIIEGNTDATFLIGKDSGNITMTKAIPAPKTFTLLVQAQQELNTRSYSVTQVTIRAVPEQQNPPRFPKSLYRGWLPPGTGTNVAVRDAENPITELTLRAQDDDFPIGELNSALQYRITNSSDFKMSGETVLTNAIMGSPQVLYVQAEVFDRLTSEKATATIEIIIQDTQPTPPGPTSSAPDKTTQGSGTQTSPTSRPPTQSSPRPPSPGPTLVPLPSSTSSTQGPSGPPHPDSGPTTAPPLSSTTVSTSATSTLRPPSSTSTLIPSLSSTVSTQGPSGPPHPDSGPTTAPPLSGTTVKPSATPPIQSSPSPGPTFVPPPSSTTVKSSATPPTQDPPGPPGPGPSGGSPTAAPSTQPGGPSTEPGSGGQEQQRTFSMTEMAAVGGVLGALLFLTLVLLGVLIYKHYGDQMKCGCTRKHVTNFRGSGYDNKALKSEDSSNWAAAPSPVLKPKPLSLSPKDESPVRSLSDLTPQTIPEVQILDPLGREANKTEEVEAQGEGKRATSNEGPIRSILTKERKSEDGGYKAVWFGEDIGAHVDVVVINSPVLEEQPMGEPVKPLVPTVPMVKQVEDSVVKPMAEPVAKPAEAVDDQSSGDEEDKSGDRELAAALVPAENAFAPEADLLN